MSCQEALSKINAAGLSYDMYNCVLNSLNSNYPESCANATPETLKKACQVSIPRWNAGGAGADFTGSGVKFIDCPSSGRVYSYDDMNMTKPPKCPNVVKMPVFAAPCADAAELGQPAYFRCLQANLPSNEEDKKENWTLPPSVIMQPSGAVEPCAYEKGMGQPAFYRCLRRNANWYRKHRGENYLANVDTQDVDCKEECEGAGDSGHSCLDCCQANKLDAHCKKIGVTEHYQNPGGMSVTCWGIVGLVVLLVLGLLVWHFMSNQTNGRKKNKK